MIKLLMPISLLTTAWLPVCGDAGEIQRLIAAYDNGVNSIGLSGDQSTLVCGLADGSVTFLQISEAAPVQQLENWITKLDDDSFKIRQHAFRRLKSSGRVAGRSLRKAIKLEHSPEVRFRLEKLLQALRPDPSEAHQASVRAVCFSPDGKRVVSAGRRGECKLWDTARGRLIGGFSKLTHGAWSVCFADGGKQLLAGGGDGTVRAWNVGSQELLAEFKALQNVAHAMAATADGRLVIIGGGFDRDIVVWDVQRQTIARRISGPNEGVLGIDVSMDGREFATVGYDGQVRIWSLCSYQQQRQFLADRALRCVAFSPNGRHVAAGDERGNLMVWDMAADQPVASRPVHHTSIRSIAYSSDGEAIYSGGDDGRVVVSRLK